MTNKVQILFIVTALLAVMSEAFVSRPMLMNPTDTKLHLKTTVPQKFSFSKQTKAPRHAEHHTEDDGEDIYHLRIVHFEHEKKNEEIDSRKYRKSSSNGNERKFGWDHREFMQSVDP